MNAEMTREEARTRISGHVDLLMTEKNVSQSELARMSGVAQSRISLLCKGELLPNPADLWNVAEALGTTLDGLMAPLPELSSSL
jgi:transcriptional regulator with XRE-family HTH domain